MGDAGFRPSIRPVEDERASLALIRMAQENPGLHTLVTLGPKTNIAFALAPDLLQLFARIVTGRRGARPWECPRPLSSNGPRS